MATLVISSSSREFVRVRISAEQGGVAVNPTVNVVEMAFTSGTEPGAPDWKSATWEIDSTTSPTTYYARCLVGPGGTVQLADGDYQVWVRITDSPDIPVKHSGTLRVT